jgi:hypothetical protein
MTFNPAHHRFLMMEEAIKLICDGAEVFTKITIVDGEKPEVVHIPSALLVRTMQKNPDKESTETLLFEDFDGDLWLKTAA